MDSLTYLAAYLLATMGLTVLIVWPESGPIAWLRDKIVRRLLPCGLDKVLDCYICLSFWCGLGMSYVAWRLRPEYWIWGGCLMSPAVFWMLLRPRGRKDDAPSQGGEE